MKITFLKNRVSFWIAFLAIFISLGITSRTLVPGVKHTGRSKLYNPRQYFLAHYAGFGFDYFILGHGLFGVKQHLKDASLLLVSSSKGLYGFQAHTMNKLFKQYDTNLKAYNLSFGLGEGYTFVTWLVQHNNLQNKFVLLDITDDTTDYHISPQAFKAVHATTYEAYKEVIEHGLQFLFDWCLQTILPRLVIQENKIVFTIPFVRGANNWRRWDTGDIVPELEGDNQAVAPGPIYINFDNLGLINKITFRVFDKHHLNYGFTTVPYKNYDPGLIQKVAAVTNHWILPPEWEDLYTKDGVHLTKTSAQKYSTRLATQMSDQIDEMKRTSTLSQDSILDEKPYLVEIFPIGYPAPIGTLLFEKIKGTYYIYKHIYLQNRLQGMRPWEFEDYRAASDVNTSLAISQTLTE